jgi:hypothetical protein
VCYNELVHSAREFDGRVGHFMPICHRQYACVAFFTIEDYELPATRDR